MKDVGQRGVEVAALKHAVPYLEMFRGKVFVVKIGGAAMGDARAMASLAEQLGVLHHLGVKVVVVHGGGPQTTALSEALGLEVTLVAGRRVTDERTLEIATMVLNGTANTALLSACRASGLPVVGLSGVDAGLVKARRRPPVDVDGHDQPVDYGHVGDIVSVDASLLRHLLDGGFLPIVSPISADERGALLNVNADSVAAAIARALPAEKLVLLQEAPGLLSNPEDPDSLVSYVDLAGLARLRAGGSLTKGMLPKAAAIESAISGGVKRAHLISFKLRDALLLELFTNEGCGTMVVAELASLLPEEQSE
ncbi:MAG: acetylglutamate kinase [Holophagales bacterium]|nr:MAG: acetylglutamate kinase [Holophagales bacterium]